MNSFKSLIKIQEQPIESRYVQTQGNNLIHLTEIPAYLSNQRHYFKVWITKRNYRFRKDFKFTRPLHMTRRYRALFFGLQFIRNSRYSFLEFYLNHFNSWTGKDIIKKIHAYTYKYYTRDTYDFALQLSGRYVKRNKWVAKKVYTHKTRGLIRRRVLYEMFRDVVCSKKPVRQKVSKVGKVNFVEGFIEITFFHNLNKRRLCNLRGKNITTFLSKFKNVWRGVYGRHFMIIYYFLSFYILRANDKNKNCHFRRIKSDFLIRGKNNLFTLILVSPKHISFYIYFIKLHLVIWYKEFLKVKVFLRPRVGFSQTKSGFFKKPKLNSMVHIVEVGLSKKKSSFLYRKLKKIRVFKSLVNFFSRFFNYFGLIYPKNIPFFWKVKQRQECKDAVIPTSVTCRLMKFIFEKFIFVVNVKSRPLTTKLVKFTSQFFGKYMEKCVTPGSSYFRARRQLISQKFPKILTRSLVYQGLIRRVLEGFKRRRVLFVIKKRSYRIQPIIYKYVNSLLLKSSVNSFKFPFWLKGYEKYRNRVSSPSSFYGFNHNFLKLDFLKFLLIKRELNEFKLYNLNSFSRGKVCRVYRTCKQFFKNNKILYLHLSGYHYWLFIQLRVEKEFYRIFLRPYNIWIFFLNYSLKYYLLAKLQFFFVHYLFYIISEKFIQIAFILRIKNFELAYDLIKEKDHSRYHIGIRPDLFITTFNRRVKKGSRWKKFFAI